MIFWNVLYDYIYLYDDYTSASIETATGPLFVNAYGDPKTGEPMRPGDGFNLKEDVLPFPNFSTDIDGDAHGNCAGISHLTTELYSKGALSEPKVTYSINGNIFSYDIGQFDENKTLTDKGLRDYKYAGWAYEHSVNGILNANLTNADMDFIKLINYYQAKENSLFDTADYVKGVSKPSGMDELLDAWYYSPDFIERIVDKLNAGEIVDACFFLAGHGYEKSGHAVNIVGYAKVRVKLSASGSSPGYVFYIYDCNNPNEYGILRTQAVNMGTKNKPHYILLYRMEVPGVGYYATSGSPRALFVAVDSDWNVLNDK